MTTRAGDPAWSAREIDHTADVGFEVDAPEWGTLLERAGWSSRPSSCRWTV